MTKDQIFEFFRRLAEGNPSPETELEYGNPYQLLVAVTLSAQATDVGVNKATRALFAQVETPRQMLVLFSKLRYVSKHQPGKPPSNGQVIARRQRRITQAGKTGITNIPRHFCDGDITARHPDGFAGHRRITSHMPECRIKRSVRGRRQRMIPSGD